MNKQLLLSASALAFVFALATGAQAQGVSQDANVFGGTNSSSISRTNTATFDTNVSDTVAVKDSGNVGSNNSASDINLLSKNTISLTNDHSYNTGSFNKSETSISHWDMINSATLSQSASNADVQSYNTGELGSYALTTGNISQNVSGSGIITASANTGVQANQGAANAVQAYSSFGSK